MKDGAVNNATLFLELGNRIFYWIKAIKVFKFQSNYIIINNYIMIIFHYVNANYECIN